MTEIPRFHPNEQQWKNVFDQSPVGIAFVGVNGEWLKVNHKLTQILEYTEDELLKISFQDITHPQDLQSDVSMMQKLEHGDIPGYEMLKRYLTKTGRIVWIRLTVWPVRNDNGKVEHYVSHIQPLTNGEKTKMEKVGDNKIQLRPTLTLGEFIADNFYWFMGGLVSVSFTMLIVGLSFYHLINKVYEIENNYERERTILMEQIKVESRDRNENILHN